MDREQFLKDYNRTEADVFTDEETGDEYIVVEPNIMDEGEPEDYKLKRINLPVCK